MFQFHNIVRWRDLPVQLPIFFQLVSRWEDPDKPAGTL